ncbi:vacuolar protein sorting-associated protein 45 [Nematocida sp. AWRm77]|nr:vacuolar protein sorting-associated protein 45 [Nematocida sp. AWRm77]
MDVLLKDIRSALSRGEGIKALLLDEFTKCALSPIIPHAELLACDFFLFDIISQERECIDVSCVSVLSKQSLCALVQEVASPRYKEYYVFFTDELSRAEIAEIANQDRHGVVKELQELYLRAVPADKGLLVAEGSGLALAQSIAYILKGLGVSPSVRYLFGSEAAYHTGHVISSFFADTEVCNGDVLVLERSFDMFTPLLYPWTYQSMAREYLSYENGTISWKGKHIYVSEDDTFFQHTKFRDILAATEYLSESLKHVKASRETAGEFVSTIRQRAKDSERLIQHLKALSEISQLCLPNDKVSEVCASVIQGEEVSPEEVFSAEYTPEQKLRAALIIYLCERVKPGQALSFLSWKKNKLLAQVKKMYGKELDAFSRLYMKDKCERKRPSYDPSKDSKLGCIPSVVRLAEKLKSSTLSTQLYPHIRNQAGTRKILVVVLLGGVSFIEYQGLCTLFAEKYPKQECIIISNKIVTGQNIVAEIEQACQET